MISTQRLITIGAAGALIAIALGLAVFGTGDDGWSAATRWTARWSLIPFVLAFAASGLLPRVHGLARDLLRNRRGLGLAFATAHFIHLFAIVTYFTVSGLPVPMIAVIGGGFGYLLILAMAVTSTDAAQRAMGAWWKRLHRVGIWYVFLIFTNSYAGRVADFRNHGAEGVYGIILLLLALGFRFWPRRQPAYFTAQP